MASSERPHVFRAIEGTTAPPDVAFRSYLDDGRVVKPTTTEAKKRRLAAVSTWITLEKAREAAVINGQGDHVAELDLALEPTIEFEGPNDRGHVDLWGDRQAMARCVIAVHDAQSDV